MYANPLEFEFQGTIFKFRKRIKIFFVDCLRSVHEGDVTRLRCDDVSRFSASNAEPGPGLSAAIPFHTEAL